jgi:hypothetical protein
MQRKYFIERILMQIEGTYVRDDSALTYNLVNSHLNDGIAVAAKTNYKDSLQIENVACVNNSFYTTFKGIAVTTDENLLYKITLPQIPLGIGRNEGINTLQFKDSNGNISLPVVFLSQAQRSYFQSMRPVQNKILAYPEGIYIYAISVLPLWSYTATVSMISGGDGNDLESTINVPEDYFPVIVEYIKAQLIQERLQVQDTANDGADTVKTP